MQQTSVLDQSGLTGGRGRLNIHYMAAGTGRPWGDTDEHLTQGTNGVVVYNNKGGEALSMTRTTHNTEREFSPNPTGNIIKFIAKGDIDKGVTPGYGGFYPSKGLASFRNGCFVQRWCAKLPAGYCFHMCSNAIGSGSRQYWLTSASGTGKWEYYVCVRECGDTGDFHTTGHVCVGKEGQPRDTIGTEKLEWYMCSYQAFTF